MNFIRKIFGKQEEETTVSHSAEDLENAKKLFFEHSCNHEYMAREYVISKYKKYNISKEQEIKWRKEFIDYWITQLSVDETTAIDYLGGSAAIEALPELLMMAENLIAAEKGDSK